MDLHSMSSNRKGNNKSRRRFDDEQIKLLETMFETESRPELRMKQQLANKLGLQPRQVAIWFQNKRARSKSKQIEHEYSMLKIRYDNLASKIESLKKEKQALLIQLQRLQKMNQQGSEAESEIKEEHVSKSDDDLNFLEYENDCSMPTCSENNSEKLDYLEEEADILNMAHADDASLPSVENNYDFETVEFFEWQYQL